MTLPVEQIRQLLYTRRDELPEDAPRIALKLVHINKCPIIAPAGMLTQAEAARLGIEGDTCRTHLQMIRSFSGLQQRLAELYSEEGFDTPHDPDLMLYSGGFFSPADKQAMDQVRQATPETLSELQLAFQDPRLTEMLLRYKARNFPASLSDEERGCWEQYRREKLIEGRDGHLSMTQFTQRVNELYQAAERSPQEREILEELMLYAESIYPYEEMHD